MFVLDTLYLMRAIRIFLYNAFFATLTIYLLTIFSGLRVPTSAEELSAFLANFVWWLVLSIIAVSPLLPAIHLSLKRDPGERRDIIFKTTTWGVLVLLVLFYGYIGFGTLFVSNFGDGAIGLGAIMYSTVPWIAVIYLLASINSWYLNGHETRGKKIFAWIILSAGIVAMIGTTFIQKETCGKFFGNNPDVSCLSAKASELNDKSECLTGRETIHSGIPLYSEECLINYALATGDHDICEHFVPQEDCATNKAGEISYCGTLYESGLPYNRCLVNLANKLEMPCQETVDGVISGAIVIKNSCSNIYQGYARQVFCQDSKIMLESQRCESTCYSGKCTNSE